MLLVDNTPIQEFYKDKTIFITGATGLLGTCLMEKLLYSCRNIKKMYILVRPKKGKNSEDRINEIFDKIFFDRIKEEFPKFKDRVCIMEGDLLNDCLGLSKEDQNIFINEVNIVFHVAATVRFNEPLRVAVKINVMATKDILELSKKSKNLNAFVYVSTAYSNCIRSEIKEEFYPPLRDPNEIIELVHKTSDEEIEKLLPSIIQDNPNTYTFTKCLSEDIVRKYGKGLPISILRPSIIMGAWREPIPGWVDGLAAPPVIMAGTSYGLLRSMQCHEDKAIDTVPLDMTANAAIVVSWKTAQNPNQEDISIYNFVNCNANPTTWGYYFIWFVAYSKLLVSVKAYWSIYFKLSKCEYATKIYQFLFHIIPALCMDTILVISGKKPQMINIYKKIHLGINLVTYFTINEWKFHDDNTNKLYSSLDARDKYLFCFDLRKIIWDIHFYNVARCIKVNMMKDPIENIREGQKLHSRYRFISNCLRVILLFVVFKLLSTYFNV